MCLGRIERLAEVWDDGGTRVARSECGVVLSLAFAPDAVVGSHVLANAGVAVRVLDPDSAEVRVTWPDGQVGSWQEVDADEVVEIARTDDAGSSA